MTQPLPPARCWYSGRTPPAEETLAVFDEAGTSTILYDHTEGGGEGEFADLVRSLYDKMDTLKRSPDDFRSWTEEDGYVTFYETLLDVAPPGMKTRVGLLQQMGAFKFRAAASPEDKKQLISAVFAELQENEDPNLLYSSRARRLEQIWAPPADSLLGYLLSRPAQVGRVLSERLNPTNDTPFKLVGHPFEQVRSSALQPIAEAKVVAFEREGEIHIIPAVRTSCDQWDADGALVGGVEQVSLIETLLLHELVELVMDEQHPEWPPLCGHVAATIFERYLKSNLLPMAVEDFFFSWPPLSEEEEAERHESQLQEELREAAALFAEEEAPDDLDDDVQGLPVDPAGSAPKKKVRKKTATKKSATGKATAKKKVRRKKP